MIKYLKILDYIGLLLLIIWVIVRNKNILHSFKDLHTSWAFMVILLQSILLTCYGYAFQVLIQFYNIKLKWQEWMGLSFISNLLNQLLPYRPGMVFRYLYLRQRYHMEVMHFAYSMMVFLLLMIIISAVFAFLGWMLSDILNMFNTFLSVTITIGLIAIIILIAFKITKLQNTTSSKRLLITILPIRSFKAIHNALHEMLNAPRILIQCSVILLFASIINAVLLYSCFKALSSTLPFGICLFFVGIYTVATIIPITPGNIGILETLFGVLTQMLYHNFALGFSALALYRLSQWVTAALFGFPFSLLLIGTILPNLNKINLSSQTRVD